MLKWIHNWFRPVDETGCEFSYDGNYMILKNGNEYHLYFLREIFTVQKSRYLMPSCKDAYDYLKSQENLKC